MRATARQTHEVTTREAVIISADCQGLLDGDELLTGVPTVTAPVGAGLVLSQKQVNASTLSINGVECLAGQAVQFKADAAAGVDGTYEIDIVCGTDAGQTRHGRIRLVIVDT